MSHRELYPEQYAHELCGKLVRFTKKSKRSRRRWNHNDVFPQSSKPFRVARVISGPFGLLAVPARMDSGTLESPAPEETTAYEIRRLTAVRGEDYLDLDFYSQQWSEVRVMVPKFPEVKVTLTGVRDTWGVVRKVVKAMKFHVRNYPRSGRLSKKDVKEFQTATSRQVIVTRRCLSLTGKTLYVDKWKRTVIETHDNVLQAAMKTVAIL